MPVHDWTRVNAGTFHDFHGAWITHLKEALNDGLLPDGYYAMAEQSFPGGVADVLTLATRPRAPRGPSGNGGGTALAEAPPQVGRKLVAHPIARILAIRHAASGHRLVALVEIVSPANKDRDRSVETFVGKVHNALDGGCNVLMIDLFPPGPHDPRGLHGAIWDHFGPDEDAAPADRPVTLASYRAGSPQTEAYVENVALGDDLPAMPLFLDDAAHVRAPLEPTYRAAYRGLPAFWRGVIEGGRRPDQG